jgi:hypothetical protein
MALDLFAGIPVTDCAAALPWYEQFFGGRPSFLPTDTEAVWEVAEHRYVYIVQEPGRAGNAPVMSFVDDLEDRVAGIGVGFQLSRVFSSRRMSLPVDVLGRSGTNRTERGRL